MSVKEEVDTGFGSSELILGRGRALYKTGVGRDADDVLGEGAEVAHVEHAHVERRVLRVRRTRVDDRHIEVLEQKSSSRARQGDDVLE